MLDESWTELIGSDEGLEYAADYLVLNLTGARPEIFTAADGHVVREYAAQQIGPARRLDWVARCQPGGIPRDLRGQPDTLVLFKAPHGDVHLVAPQIEPARHPGAVHQ